MHSLVVRQSRTSGVLLVTLDTFKGLRLLGDFQLLAVNVLLMPPQASSAPAVDVTLDAVKLATSVCQEMVSQMAC